MAWFVYRSPYEGPLSRRVVRLSDPTILAWFQRGWGACFADPEPEDWLKAQVGYVYGLGSIFRRIHQLRLPIPTDWDELVALLREHLYVEGGPDHIRDLPGALSIRTDDDELQLAYFFLDDAFAEAHPERVRYLLHDSLDWRLPHLPPEPVAAPTTGPTTWLVPLTFYDSQNFDLSGAWRVAGVRLGGLARWLAETPTPETRDWPLEARLLRGLLDPGAPSLRAGLEAAGRFPVQALAARTAHLRLLEADDVPRALRTFLASDPPADGDPERSKVLVAEHAAILCLHASAHAGYQQWILFDDVWSAARPLLCASLLRYARRWDPLHTPTPPLPVPETFTGVPGGILHPLMDRPLPQPRRTDDPRLLAVLRAAEHLRVQRLAQASALRAAADNLTGRIWLEPPVSLPEVPQEITRTDLVRAVVAVAPEVWQPPLPASVYAAAHTALAGAVAVVAAGEGVLAEVPERLLRRWSHLQAPLTLAGLAQVLAPEAIPALMELEDLLVEGLITLDEAEVLIRSRLGVDDVAPVAAGYADWFGGLGALRRALSVCAVVVVVGEEGTGRRALIAAAGLSETEAARCRCRTAAAVPALLRTLPPGTRVGQVCIPPLTDAGRILSLLAHQPRLEALGARAWSLIETLRWLEGLSRASEGWRDWSLGGLVWLLEQGLLSREQQAPFVQTLILWSERLLRGRLRRQGSRHMSPILGDASLEVLLDAEARLMGRSLSL